MATPHFGGLLAACIALVTIHLGTAQEFCATNQCPNNEPCYNRPGSTESTFACECPGETPFFMGYDCSISAFTMVKTTCFGSSCQTGFYTSPNYPNQHFDRDTRSHFIFIPGATEITFFFSDPFEVEPFKDELYIGEGLTYDDRADLIGVNMTQKQIYFFENYTVPTPLTINSDAAFIVWKTDKNIRLSGFRVDWVGAVDITPPTFTCPDSIDRTVDITQAGSFIQWTEPNIFDESGVQSFSSSIASGSFFQVGLPVTVTYTGIDTRGNIATCNFIVSVTAVDSTPPIVICPQDITETVEIGTAFTQVNFNTPSVSDDSGSFSLVQASHQPGDSFTTGTTRVTYTYADGSQNTASCSFLVNIIAADTTPPVVTCPPDVTEIVELGIFSTQVSFDTPMVSDNSGIFSLVQASHQPGASFPTGSSTVTYTYTDGSRNTASCSFLVNIIAVDTTPPVILNCPSPLDVVIDFGATSGVVGWQTVSATDNSGQVDILRRSHNNGDIFTLGTTPVTIEFTDPSANTALCSFLVTVTAEADNIPPVVNCPPDVTEIVELGTSSRQVSFDTPMVSDNSGIFSLVQASHQPGATFTTGTTTVTYTYADGSGNTASCSFVINIIAVDRVPPQVTCPADEVYDVEVPLSGRTVTFGTATAIDFSAVSLVSVTPQNGFFFSTGSTTVTYTYRDASNNQASCSFLVTINSVDRVPPQVTCPADEVYDVEVPLSGRTVTFGTATAIDFSAVSLVSVTPQTGTFFSTGSTTVTYTYRDTSNNEASCSFLVTINSVDSTPPDIQNCPPQVNEEIGFGATSGVVAWPIVFASDNSGQLEVPSLSHNNGGIFPLGTTAVTIEFRDLSGNTAVCSFTVTVTAQADNIPPVVNCPLDITEIVELGTSSRQVSFDTPMVSDNSGSFSLVQASHQPGDSFTTGTTRVTYTYADGSGNTASCSFQINIIAVDRVPPQVTCPPDEVYDVEVPLSGRTVTFGTATAFDFSTVSLVSVTPQTGTFFSTGSTTVTYTYRDTSNNEASCSFLVTINSVDRVPPQVTCPPDEVYDVEVPLSGRTVTFGTATAIDFSAVSLVSVTPQTGTFFSTGSTTVTYTYRDASNNQASCSFLVTINSVDRVPPQVTCPADEVYDVEVPLSGRTVTFGTATAIDFSAVSLVSVTPQTGTFFSTGSTTVTYTYRDASNNQASCSFLVTINSVDNTPPDIQNCPPQVNEEIGFGATSGVVAWPIVFASDNSGQLEVPSLSHNNGGIFPLGTTAVTIEFRDLSGNTAVCSFTVTVTAQADNIPPVVNCPPDVTETVELGTSSRQVSFDTPMVSDNSGSFSLLQASHQPGDSFTTGTTRVTYTYADGSGNIASCSFVINIIAVDRVPPQVTCPPDEVYDVEVPLSGRTVTFGTATAIDFSTVSLVSVTPQTGTFFSTGSTTVTYTYRDTSNNEASCSFLVTINSVDRVPPQVTCPPDEVYDVEVPLSGRTVTFGTATAIDFSAVSLVSVTPQTGTFFSTGSTTVTYTYRDASNNQASCSFLVTINSVDNTPPDIQNCPPQVNEEIGFGATSGVVAWPIVFASDNSGQLEVPSLSHNNGGIFPLGTTAVTIEFRDLSGNTAVCSFTVTVTAQADNIPPVVNCPLDITETVELGTSSRQVSFDTPVVSDNSGSFSLLQASHQPGDSFTTGTTRVTYTYADGNGNTASCSFVINIIAVDRVPPQVTCPADEVYDVEVPLNGRTVTFGTATAFDFSTVSLVSVTPQTGTFFSTGSTTVTYTYRDTSNNEASCSFLVTINSVDRVPPQVTCPADEVYDVEVPLSGRTVTFGTATAIDFSAVSLVSVTPQNGFFFSTGSTTVTYTYRDASNNQASCSFLVTINSVDNTPPDIQNCPPQVNEEIGFGATSGVVAWPIVFASDNSGQLEVPSLSHNNGGIFPLGTTAVTIEFRDLSGNTAVCSFTVTVTAQADNIPPVVNCPPDVTETVELGTSSRQVSFDTPMVSDNSGSFSLVQASHQPGDSFTTGTTRVTYTYADGSGNTASCSFVINIIAVDRVPPQVTCPPDEVYDVEVPSSGRTVTFGTATAIDFSTVSLVSVTPQTGTFFSTGSTTVTYTYRDTSNNEASCSFLVTINSVDRVPPQVTCPPDEVYDVEVPLSGRTVTFGTATAIDFSAVSLVSVTPQTGTFFSTGSTTVTYTYRDASNNQASCSFLVTINSVDNTPPDIQNCPPQVNEEIGFGATSGVVAWPIVFASDNSGQLEVPSLSHNNGGIFPLGTTAVTIEFRDLSGNTAVCSFTVTVTAQADNIPPVVNCPPDVTETVELGTSSRQVSFDTPVVSDNSGSFSLVQASHQPGDSFTTGTTRVTYTYADGSGNIASCSFVINIIAVDRVPPQVTCPPDEVYDVEVPLSGRTVTFGTATAIDFSTVSLVSVTPQTGTFFSTGSTTVTYTYRDTSNNEASCSFLVTINSVDRVPPQVTCPPDEVYDVEVPLSGRTVTFGTATAIDFSAVSLVSVTPQTGTFFSTGSTTVTYTYRDASNNQASCSFLVTINSVDNTPPDIQNCPPQVNEEIGFGATSGVVAWPIVFASDNSGQLEVPSLSHNNGGIFPLGTTAVTIEFRDLSGNTAVCSFTVTVTAQADNIPPVVNCPLDITETVELGTSSRQVSFDTPVVSDNSGSFSLVQASHQPGDSFTTGTTRVTYTYADGSGNIASCSFVINIIAVDRVPPQVTCPPDEVYDVEVPLSGRTVTFGTATAFDFSTVSLVSVTPQTGTFFSTGSTTVTYTYRDTSNNEASCSFLVTINSVDRVPPQVTCPADEVYDIEVPLSGRTVTFGTATAIDFSAVSLVSVTPQTGTFFSTGSTTVTYTYRDTSNNQASCSFLVTVNSVDTTNPQIVCPQGFTESSTVGTGGTVVTWISATATDNSGSVTVTSDRVSPMFLNFGETIITYTARDPSGNIAICSFTIVVIEVDNVPPVVTCPPDVTEIVELGTSSTQVSFDTPMVSDNSGIFSLVQASHQPGATFTTGATTVTYTYTDGSGNTASCSFQINIIAEDRIPPQVTCPADEVYDVEVPSSGRTVTFGTASATDLSTVSLVSVTPQNGFFFSTGSTTVTYTYRDTSNNQASCSFSVIVNSVDTTNPQIVCPQGFTESSTVGTGGTVVTWISATATDNSGSVTVTSDRVSPMYLNFGETTITYTARDPSGNIAICSFTIVVLEVDNEPPLIQNCPPSPLNTVIDLDQAFAQVFWPLVLATDNSGIEPVVNPSHSSGSSFPVGQTTVTIEFTDSALNTAQCLFVVNVIQSDPVPPLITGCPGDIERSISLEATDTPVSWIPPSATDNDGEIPDLISNFSPGARFSPGVWNVIYTSTDRAGNTQQCQFSITISRVDDEPPSVTCPASIQQIVIEGSAGTYVTWDPPAASDNSGTVEFVSSTASSGDLFAIGLNSVTYTYSDPSGNQASCSFTVTITSGSPCNPNPCQNDGLCVPTDLTSYQCICTECFTGTNCETNLNACVNNLCENGAICIPDPGSCTDYSCQCTDCFTGRFCNLPLDSCENHQCQNGGGCTVDPLNCVLYTCTCPLCFTGQFCEQEVSACTFNLCANGANCVPVGTICTEYKCSCPGCYTGAYCNELRDPCFNNPCMNGGICSALNDGNCFSYTCECSGCNTGYNCEITIPSPCSGNPCQNGGNCLSIQGQCAAYQCQCPANFGGLHCENVVTTNPNPCNSFPCLNGAECLTMDSTFYTCLCRSGFAGIDCQQPTLPGGQATDLCLTNPCQNGATCVASYHSSNRNFYQPQYYCICNNGFTGTNCQQQTAFSPNEDICNVVRPERPDCQGGAPCYNSYQSFTSDVDYYCDCPIGLTGHNCETIAPNPCESNPCQNGGNCLPFKLYYTCSCPQGFLGDRCQTSTDITVPAILNCPADIEVQVAFGQTMAFATWQEPTSPDGNRVFRSDAPSTLFPLGTTSVSYVFEDVSGNRASCTFFVIVSGNVVDDTPPTVFGCPGDITATVPLGSQTTTAIWQLPGAADNNGAATLTSNYSPGDVFPAGITEVVYVATDSAGLTARCSFNVIAQLPVDETPPVIDNCPEERFATLPDGSSTVPVVWPAPQASDNSGQVTLSSNYNPGDSFPPGQTLVFYAAKDPYGLLTSCTFTVFVSTTGDTNPPVISGCPENQFITAPPGSSSVLVTWIPPTATDDTGIVTLTGDSTPGSSFPVGTTSVRYEARDSSGLVSRCTFQIFVTADGGDTVPPVITNCPTDQFATLPAGSPSVAVSWIEPTATDNRGTPLLFSNFNPGDLFPLGSRTVTYTARDSSGLEAFCSFNVVVSGTTTTGDTTSPVFVTCPSSQTITVSQGQTSTTAVWTTPTATDNAGAPTVIQTAGPGPGGVFSLGSTPVTYTARDGAGLEETCVFNIIVTVPGGGTTQDNIPPVISGCDESVSAISNGDVVPVSWNVPTATDNGVEIPPSSTPPFSSIFIPPGNYGPFNYVFTDIAGNSAVCPIFISISGEMNEI
ncbi:mucin-17-like [Lytechinus variegatus]|uniref:mucin-17-like n=1 Tax=Lytechinus variegatus TaxID=7654 RepID=UPI001BB1D1A7|nr:mucin-17-like [Lytechinus variegatus]